MKSLGLPYNFFRQVRKLQSYKSFEAVLIAVICPFLIVFLKLFRYFGYPKILFFICTGRSFLIHFNLILI